jgi:hypothetical protein
MGMTHSHHAVIVTGTHPDGYLGVALWCVHCAEVVEVPDDQEDDVCAFCPEWESGLVDGPLVPVTQC